MKSKYCVWSIFWVDKEPFKEARVFWTIHKTLASLNGSLSTQKMLHTQYFDFIIGAGTAWRHYNLFLRPILVHYFQLTIPSHLDLAYSTLKLPLHRKTMTSSHNKIPRTRSQRCLKNQRHGLRLSRRCAECPSNLERLMS